MVERQFYMFNSIIYYLLKMDMPKSEEKIKEIKGHKDSKKDYWHLIELFSIIFALGLIFYIWEIYPDTLQKIDKQNTPITVPFNQKYNDDLPYDEKKSYAQKIGEKYGTYGDTYGSLNTLFSGWAFALLLISLFMQRQELQAQRKELAAQRMEAKESNNIAEKQRVIADQQASLIYDQIREAQKQNFHTLLFKFFDDKNLKVSKLIIRFRSATIRDSVGNEVFKDFGENFKTELGSVDVPIVPNDDGSLDTERENQIKRLEGIYYYVSENYHFNFEESYYFEFIEFILGFIKKNQSLTEIDQIIEIFLSNFTFHEIICMASIAVIKKPNLEKYINEFGLLRNINSDLLSLAQLTNLKLLFDENAFTGKTTKPATLDFMFVENGK